MFNILFHKVVFLAVVNLFLFILQLNGAHKDKTFLQPDTEHIQMISLIKILFTNKCTLY
jgi:hypothetical protein